MHFGDRKGAYAPHVPTQPRWDDPVWESNVPVTQLTLAASETQRLIPILHRLSGGGGSWLSLWRSRETEGACALASIPDTS